MNRDLNYEKNNLEYDEVFTEIDGGGIKCKNYELCECILPKWWFECKQNYLCTNCHIMFGTWGENYGKGILEIINNIDCPICLECKKGISQPNCDHFVCIDCFKRCYYSDDDEDNKPIFPYLDMEDEYYEDNLNPKWKKDYPLIELYNKEYDKWEEEKNEKYDNEENLRKCPLCRK